MWITHFATLSLSPSLIPNLFARNNVLQGPPSLSLLPVQGAQVPSLVWGTRSNMLQLKLGTDQRVNKGKYKKEVKRSNVLLPLIDNKFI